MGNSKRNIKKLNDNFREDILDYAFAHNLKCANALAILYATGCRPDELQTGVTVNYDSKKNEIEFRYRIIDGKADKSYGINVARLAHLPKVVLDRAAQLLTNFENQDNNQNYQPSLFVMEQVQPEKSKLLQQLQELDIDSMTPRDALDCLYELKKLSEKIEL